MKKTIKDKIKAKAKSTKAKVKAKANAVKAKVKSKVAAIKAKVKGGTGTALAALAVMLFAAGCSTATPASRYTATTIGDVSVENNVNDLRNRAGSTNSLAAAKAPLVSISTTISLSDVTVASADSSGSTETQTATPTTDIKPDIDVRYNDALAAASVTSKGILETLTETGMRKVLSLMESGGSGTVVVDNVNGGQTTVTCENGQCVSSNCADGSCSPAK